MCVCVAAQAITKGLILLLNLEDPILAKKEWDLGGILTCVKCDLNMLDWAWACGSCIVGVLLVCMGMGMWAYMDWWASTGFGPKLNGLRRFVG